MRENRPRLVAAYSLYGVMMNSPSPTLQLAILRAIKSSRSFIVSITLRVTICSLFVPQNLIKKSSPQVSDEAAQICHLSPNFAPWILKELLIPKSSLVPSIHSCLMNPLKRFGLTLHKESLSHEKVRANSPI